MSIKVKEIDDLIALLTQIKHVEHQIDSSSYVLGGSYQGWKIDKYSQFEAIAALHFHIQKGLREYRKALIRDLKKFSVEVDQNEQV